MGEGGRREGGAGDRWDVRGGVKEGHRDRGGGDKDGGGVGGRGRVRGGGGEGDGCR